MKIEKKTEWIKKYYRQVIKIQDIRTINDFNAEDYNEYRVVAIIDKTCIPWQKSDWYYVILEKEII